MTIAFVFKRPHKKRVSCFYGILQIIEYSDRENNMYLVTVIDLIIDDKQKRIDYNYNPVDLLA